MALCKPACEHGREYGTNCPECVKHIKAENKRWLELLGGLDHRCCGTCMYWEPGFKPLGECAYKIELPDSLNADEHKRIAAMSVNCRPMSWVSGESCPVYQRRSFIRASR